MGHVATLLYSIVGLINFAPILGVISAGRLAAMYGVALGDPNLVALMRHRAVLLGIVGLLLIASALHLPLRPVAALAGLVSMFSYLVIVIFLGDSNVELRRVALVDLVALVLLLGAFVADRFSGVGSPS
jgi:hypothetical protein